VVFSWTLFTLDPKRVEEFVARNGARFDGATLEARPTGIPVPIPRDGEIESVDLYLLDAASLLRYVRVNRLNAEQIIFSLLGHGADGYVEAQKALSDAAALATEVAAPAVDESAADHECG
jgi:hypothetical protein